MPDRGGPLCSSPPTTARRATWPPICRLSSPPGGCTSIPPGAPATSPTWRRRRTWPGFGSGRSRRSRAATGARWWWPAPSRSPRQCPTPSCGPTGWRSAPGRASTSETSPSCSRRRDTSGSSRSRSEASSRSAGDILDAYPATEERAIRVELFGDEIESLRWFSTFTQRSLGDAERVELAPAAELGAEHRELADLIRRGGGAARPRRADSGRQVPGAAGPGPARDPDRDSAQSEEIPRALSDHWEDVTAAMHADDARRLYVDVGELLQERASLRLGADAGQELALRAQRAEFPSRTPAEGEAEMEKLVRSGYRVVVAFERGGEAERTRFNLARVEAPLLGSEADPAPGVNFTEARLREGFIAPDLKLAVIPYSRPGPPPPPGRGPRRGEAQDRRGRRAAGRRPRRARGPRGRALLGLRHQDPRRA